MKFNNIFRGKKVFITGHTGFKGSWLTMWLLSLGASVKGYSLEVPSNPSIFEALGLCNEIDDCRGNILNEEKLQQELSSFNPDFVFHLAAQAIVKRSYDNPKEAFETNGMGTFNILNAIRSVPSVKVCLIITSDKCYENVEWEFGYRETDRLGGRDPYSASKACAEIIFASMVNSFFNDRGNPKICSVRAGNVIGGGDWAANRIVPDAVVAAASDNVLKLRFPNSTRPWQHVLEPLSGYLLLAQRLWESSDYHGLSFNFGPGADVVKSVAELVDEMNKYWPKIGYETTNSLPNIHEASLLKLNCDRAIHRLNWTPTLSFEETVKFTTEWYRSFYENGMQDLGITKSQIQAYEEIAFIRGKVWLK